MQSQETSIRVSRETHNALVAYLENTDRKIGKFVDAAVIEKIEREKREHKIKEKSGNN